MKKIAMALFCIGLLTQILSAQMTLPREIRSDATSNALSLPPSNGVTYMSVEGTTLWVGTSNGLGRTTDFGISWQSFRANSAFAHRGIFSLATEGSKIWAATGYDFELDGGSVQTGSGYGFSLDSGATWEHLPQAMDDRGDSIISYGVNDSLRILPIVVPQQNVTFDISISPMFVWIASWSSGLRRSSDNGQTWERILLPPDNRNSLSPGDTLWSYASNDTLHTRKIWQKFDPRFNNNFLAFSVLAIDDDTVWCGTAGGINKTYDGGITWVKYSHQNQRRPILGNWVISIDKQIVNGHRRIWATNWQASDSDEEYGVSYTDDEGASWKNLLEGIKAYDFGFKDSIAYIATEVGLFRSADLGKTFQQFSVFTDSAPGTYIPTPKVYSVGVIDDSVYIGTDNGIMKTIDNATNTFGSSWKIFRTYQQVGTKTETYAYPNPFTPSADKVARIHYGAKNSEAYGTTSREVSIEIFDFSMNRVRSLITKAQRDGAREYDETWDGRDNNGDVVPNGVYFYRVELDSDEPLFGKILVLQ